MGRAREPLGRSAWWLLCINGLFALSISLSNTFLNVYLWKVDKTFGPIGWFNLATYCLLPAAFLLAGWLSERYHSVLAVRIGVLLHGCFYAVTLWGGMAVARRPIWLGMLMGAAAGFYWCGFNELSLRFTSSSTRDRFNGMGGVVRSIAGMVAPPVAGTLIAFEDRFGGLSGYHVIFAISLALFVLAAATSWLLPTDSERGDLNWHATMQGLRDKPWRRLLLANMVYGLREGVFIFLIGLLLYIATGSEMGLGAFVLLQSGLSFISFYVVGRWVHVNNRVRAMGIGSIAMAAGALLFLLPLHTTTLVVYGAAMSLFLPLFLVPVQSMVFDAIGRLNERTEDNIQMENIIAREIFSNAGRVVGILIFLLWIRLDITGRSIPRLAVIFGFVQLISWVLVKGGMRRVGKANGGERNDTSEHLSVRGGGRRSRT